MSRLFFLDTNHVSDFIRNRSAAVRQTVSQHIDRGDSLAISSLTHAELSFGFAKNPAAIHSKLAYDSFRVHAITLPWTEDAAASYAHLRLELKARRLVIDTIDLLIASQAHSLGALLVTRDNGFRHLSGLLDVVNWATDIS